MQALSHAAAGSAAGGCRLCCRRWQTGALPYWLQALRAMLLDGLAEGTVRWGCRLQGYEEDGEGVTLRFDGGGEARASVLVGCDGIWCAVRTNGTE